MAGSCLYAWRKRFGCVLGDAVRDQPRLIPVMVGDAAAPPPQPMPARLPHVVVMLADGTRLEIEAGYPTAASRQSGDLEETGRRERNWSSGPGHSVRRFGA